MSMGEFPSRAPRRVAGFLVFLVFGAALISGQLHARVNAEPPAPSDEGSKASNSEVNADIGDAPAPKPNSESREIGPRRESYSGFPVPRFVSLKGPEDFCRLGPSREHPVQFTFKKSGLPVRVIAETRDHWRKIEDQSGDQCWVHKTRLKAVTHLLSLEEVAIHRAPRDSAPVRIRVGSGVLVELEKEKGEWVKVDAGDKEGWAHANLFWGAPSSLSQ